MPEIVAGFAGWEPPRDAAGPQSVEQQMEAARMMGGNVLPASALPAFVRDGYAEWFQQQQRNTGSCEPATPPQPQQPALPKVFFQ